MTVLVAPVVGPLLGGWITDNIAWPWIFYINMPVGLVAAALDLADLPQARDADAQAAGRLGRPRPAGALGRRAADHARQGQGARLVRLDARSSCWRVVAVVGFALLPGLGADRASTRSSTCACSRGATSWTGTLALSLAYGVFFGNVVLLPLWLQQYMGYTATWPGWCWRRSACSRIVLSPLRRQDTCTAIDPRRFATVAFLVLRARAVACARASTPQADFWTIMMPTLIQGAAMAFFFIPLLAHQPVGPAARAHAGRRRG